MKKKVIVTVSCVLFLATTAVAICWQTPSVFCAAPGVPYMNGPSSTCYGQPYFTFSKYSNTTLTGTACGDLYKTGYWSCDDGYDDGNITTITIITRSCTWMGVKEVTTTDSDTIRCPKGFPGADGCTTGA
jgi:hypothetical protein